MKGIITSLPLGLDPSQTCSFPSAFHPNPLVSLKHSIPFPCEFHHNSVFLLPRFSVAFNPIYTPFSQTLPPKSPPLLCDSDPSCPGSFLWPLLDPTQPCLNGHHHALHQGSSLIPHFRGPSGATSRNFSNQSETSCFVPGLGCSIPPCPLICGAPTSPRFYPSHSQHCSHSTPMHDPSKHK